MSVSKAKVRGMLTGMVGAAILASLPSAVSAQGLIEFLWGGEPEFGGQKRQMVTFSSQYKPGHIIVSFGDRRLYHVTTPGKAMSYPIAIPREQSRWQGNTVVSMKRENPDWRPTAEMLRENPKLPSWVPGGHPMNPLGVRALYLGSSTYRIHGTDAPWTIGQNVSKGCIRMFNEDVIDLYPKVPVGTKVVVTWDRFNTTGTGEPIADAGSNNNGNNGANSNGADQSAPAVTASAKTKTRSVTSPPKAGFFIYPDDETNPVKPEEDMVTRKLNSDGTYSDETDEVSSPATATEGESSAAVKQRYGRKVGAGAVSRAASQASIQ